MKHTTQFLVRLADLKGNAWDVRIDGAPNSTEAGVTAIKQHWAAQPEGQVRAKLRTIAIWHWPDCLGELSPVQVQDAYQRTAEACGGDILQALAEFEPDSPLVIERDGLTDLLSLHGGPDGQAVTDWIMQFEGTMEDLDQVLDRIGVPKTWA